MRVHEYSPVVGDSVMAKLNVRKKECESFYVNFSF